jgi:hypothetical protein
MLSILSNAHLTPSRPTHRHIDTSETDSNARTLRRLVCARRPFGIQHLLISMTIYVHIICNANLHEHTNAPIVHKMQRTFASSLYTRVAYTNNTLTYAYTIFKQPRARDAYRVDSFLSFTFSGWPVGACCDVNMAVFPLVLL